MDELALEGTPPCVAPFVAMEFDPSGSVQACCANTLFPLGRVGQQSLSEIWRGERAQRLRAAVLAGDLTLGCTICSHRIRHHGAELPLQAYEQFGQGALAAEWPRRLSFSLHNTCNLECVMCGADRSSRIRTRRAGLPGLPHVYDDRFFEELPPFLRHCEFADFVGGEPFLVREHWRVWDLLADVRPDAVCSVTTNGTVWNDRVEWVLDTFPTHVRLSLDALEPELFERIRVGADFGEVMSNFDRFLAYSRERSTSLAVSFCLLKQNWHELAGVLLWAEDLGIDVTVQTVLEREFGAQHLADGPLREVLDAMRDQERGLDGRVVRNRAVWDRQITMLETELARRSSGERLEPCFDAPGPGNSEFVGARHAAWRASGSPDGGPDLAAVDRYLAGWDLDRNAAAVVDLGGGRVRRVDPGSVLPASFAALGGRTLSELLDAWCAELAGQLWVLEELDAGSFLVQTLGVSGVHRDGAGPVIRLISFDHGPDGRRTLVFSDSTVRPPPVPVDLRSRSASA